MRRYYTAFTLTVLLSLLLCGGCSALLLSHFTAYFWIPLALWLLLAVCATVVLLRFRAASTNRLLRLSKKISPDNRSSLDAFPLPLVLIDESGAILYTNKLFHTQVAEGETPTIGSPITSVFDGFSMTEVAVNPTMDLMRNQHRYTVYVSGLRAEKGKQYLLYLTEDTELKEIAEKFDATRPAVLQICIDNLEEVTEHLRTGDRARIGGSIETMLEDWITANGGFLQKYSTERFIAVTEHQYIQSMREDRFSILDKIRKAFPETDGSITLSIGVGEGKSVEEGRQMSLRALDMALSRGGDQVAIKTIDGFDFYGGHSSGIAQSTRVRTRIIAEALQELLLSSDRVLIMGHRISDLDSLGGCTALAMAARRMGLSAYAVVNSTATMAGRLIKTYEKQGVADLFMEPETALKHITKRTLLIVVDTHAIGMLESADLFHAAERVVVIDHHRRMVNYIENAILTYHEPNSSSACELIAELLPYFPKNVCKRAEAEALLSGIMLDTRNFVLRTGVRTFEAAAYLRSLGADTVTVKKLFSENIELYKLKNDLIANAKLYRETAITVSYDDLTDKRVATAQAADDLLSVKGVTASFVIAKMNGCIQISARSFGECNVQLIMESLGGGGHLTMAATQIPDVDVDGAYEMLTSAIDRYFDHNA